MMRCCGRISYFRILHLSRSQRGNRKKKQLVLAMNFDSLPDNSRTNHDVYFVTKFTVARHTLLRLPRGAPAARLSCTKLPAILY
jgi:hypothetical protein